MKNTFVLMVFLLGGCVDRLVVKVDEALAGGLSKENAIIYLNELAQMTEPRIDYAKDPLCRFYKEGVRRTDGEVVYIPEGIYGI